MQVQEHDATGTAAKLPLYILKLPFLHKPGINIKELQIW
jgi:hypothetical protein